MRRDHLDHDRRSLRTECAHGASARTRFPVIAMRVAAACPKPVAKDNVDIDARSDRSASLRRDGNSRCRRIRLFERRSRQSLGARGAIGQATRLSQRAGHRSRADRHDQFPDGLRHDRHRAGHRAGKIQTARRRRHVENRQPNGQTRRWKNSVTIPKRSSASSRTSTRSTRSKTCRTATARSFRRD